MIYRSALIATLAALAMSATQASARPLRESSYEMVTVQHDQNVSVGASTRRRNVVRDKVIILDKRTGDLWAWSEALQTTMYLGYIFPVVQTGWVARVIRVLEERPR